MEVPGFWELEDVFLNLSLSWEYVIIHAWGGGLDVSNLEEGANAPSLEARMIGVIEDDYHLEKLEDALRRPQRELATVGL